MGGGSDTEDEKQMAYQKPTLVERIGPDEVFYQQSTIFFNRLSTRLDDFLWTTTTSVLYEKQKPMTKSQFTPSSNPRNPRFPDFTEIDVITVTQKIIQFKIDVVTATAMHHRK